MATMSSGQVLAGRARATPRFRPSVFWAAFWLAVVLVVAKALDLGLPGAASWGGWLKSLIVATAADNLFVLLVAIPALVTMLVTAHWPRVQRGMWVGWLLMFALLALYGAVSVVIFSYTRMPLTRQLITAAGDMENMSSSVAVFLDARTAAVLSVVPLAYVAAVWLSWRRVGPLRGWLAHFAFGSAVVLVLAQSVYCQVRQRDWVFRPDHHVCDNPHWALISSSLPVRLGSRDFRLPHDVPESYLEDFRPVSSRPGAPPLALPSRPKNVIIYVMESVGTQHLGLYGSPFATTPHLEAEAAHSLVFDNFYCHVGMTPSSLVAMTSSNYALTVWQPHWDHSRPLWQPGILLAQVLKEHGFHTAMITSSDIFYDHQRGFLEGRGFDQILDKHDLNAPALFSWGVADGVMVDNMLGWIDRHRDAPFFVLSWTSQTHHPYELLPGEKERDLVQGKVPTNGSRLNRYLNCLQRTDELVGRLLDGLRQRGLADDTLVVITGDHGEGFNYPHQSLGHGFKIYNENVNIPLLLWNPKLFTPGKRLATVGGLIELAPTITNILGFTPAPTWTGRSLFDPDRPPRAYFYGAHEDVLLGLRQGEWEYIYNASTGVDELYDLASDRLEQANVASAHPEACDEFRRRVAAWVRHLDRARSGA